jgi:hypothetical protein
MSAAEALKAARAAGIKLAIDGDDLVLEASASPPSAVIDCLTGHKTEIVAMLRSGHDGWSAEDWRLFFEERAAIAEFDGGLPRTEADAQALACCIVEWLNRNPTPSAPGRCAWCGQAESRDAVACLTEWSPEPTSGRTLNAGQRGRTRVDHGYANHKQRRPYQQFLGANRRACNPDRRRDCIW